MRQMIWSQLSEREQQQILQRPAQRYQVQVQQGVAEIINRVKTHGDTALLDYTQRFDKVTLAAIKRPVAQTAQQCEFSLQQAINQAIARVRTFHHAQRPQPIKMQIAPGVICEQQYRPIERVGLYIPGGSAPLISTVYMLGVPAQLAGCQTRVLCTPPRHDGSLHPAIAYAAQQCGINDIYLLGGAQAIAAMAYGTTTVPKVNKIFGPGNQWATEAKQQVSLDPMGAQLDIPAGPSEILVIADDQANPEFVAADLLSQAEHGADSQVILLCLSEDFVERVKAAMQAQLVKLRRGNTLEVLAESLFIIVDSLQQALSITNTYAPEHLLLQCQQPESLMSKINSAGAVFIGAWAPESVGDYASGTNHVLPTYGYARCMNGLGLRDFMKAISVQTLTAEGLKTIGPCIETIAAAEGLIAHQQAVSLRLANLPEIANHNLSAIPPCRLNIAHMTPYRSARREVTTGEVLLNANENPQDVLFAKAYNRYPQPQPPALIERLGNLYSISPQQLLIGRGSDEAIDMLVRAYCQASQDAIITLEPTYGMYEVSAQIQGVDVIKVPLRPQTFELDVDALLAAWMPSVKLIFLCSPNNPTGNVLDHQAIKTLCRALAGKTLVVVDEAYIEFATKVPSMVSALNNYANLVILRTLSKAYGLAGLRCGCVLAHAEVIQVLITILAPYPLATPVVNALLNGLTESGIAGVKQSIANLVLQREALQVALGNLSFVKKIWPSVANYILLRVCDAAAVVAHCQNQGVLIRDLSKMLGLANCIRISIGTPAENQKLLEVLKAYR